MPLFVTVKGMQLYCNDVYWKSTPGGEPVFRRRHCWSHWRIKTHFNTAQQQKKNTAQAVATGLTGGRAGRGRSRGRGVRGRGRGVRGRGRGGRGRGRGGRGRGRGGRGRGRGGRGHRRVESEDEESEVRESASESESEVYKSESESEVHESGSESESAGEISVGDNVSCNWYQDGDDDQWYQSVVLDIDIESRTAHVRAEDGDEIEDMSWNWIIKL